jgi:hypothetical protein
MRTMTKRMMNEEMMSNPMRMKVTIKMATNTLGLIFKHVHKICDQDPLRACSCTTFFIIFIIYIHVVAGNVSMPIWRDFFYLTTIRIQIRIRIGGPFLHQVNTGNRKNSDVRVPVHNMTFGMTFYALLKLF